jgi:hypothetical protein
VDKLIEVIEYHAEIEKIYKSSSQVVIKFFNLKDKERMSFLLSRLTWDGENESIVFKVDISEVSNDLIV